MNPRWPIFIPTKGRHESRHTIKMFDALDVPYTIFVEAHERDLYAQHVAPERIHVLPHRDRGLTATRNYIWDYATQRGTPWFWTFDDNISGLFRFNYNLKTPCGDATIMAVIEDFVERYENVAIAGMNYFMFVIRKEQRPPYTLNTRVYSNMLIRTGLQNRDGSPLRNVTFFNDDTDLCLRVLKDGWVTVLFNAFLIEKKVTMTIKGGMTEYYEKTNKRREFVEELIRAHPDIVRMTERWGRWHHWVDYSRFKQTLKRRANVVVPQGVNNYGMILQERRNGSWQTMEIPADRIGFVDDDDEAVESSASREYREVVEFVEANHERPERPEEDAGDDLDL
jgi:hypothetical protein